MNYEPLGIAAGVVGSVSTVPQIYKSWSSRSSKDISTWMIVLVYVSTVLGIWYGVLIQHLAIYVGNSVTLGLYMVLHLVKIRNGALEREQAQESDVELSRFP